MREDEALPHLFLIAIYVQSVKNRIYRRLRIRLGDAQKINKVVCPFKNHCGIMDVVNAIQSRRSIRKFKDIPVSKDNVEILIEAARLAPSPGNDQNWMFGVVTNKKKIKALSEAAGGQHWIASAPLVIALCTELSWSLKELGDDDYGLQVNKERFGSDFIEYLKDYPDQRSVALLFENSNPLIAGEHIFLTAISLELSACWIGYLDIKKASSILNLPSNYVCLFLMTIGYAAADPIEIERKSIEDITFSNEYK